VRRAALFVAAVLSGMVLGSTGAHAACHIAAFTETDHRVREDAGRVRITVELVGGQPSCAGSVRYRTQEGSALAGSDFRAAEGELRFVAGDDRMESFTIRILDDDEAEDVEEFTVRLSPGSTPGTIQQYGTPATVRIRDDDEERPAETTSPEDADDDDVTASPTPRTSPRAVADSDDGSGAPVVPIIIGALAVAALAGGGLWMRRRASGSP